MSRTVSIKPSLFLLKFSNFSSLSHPLYCINNKSEQQTPPAGVSH